MLLLLCRHVGLLLGKRLDTNLLRHRIRKYPDSPVHTLSDSLRIYIFFYLESGLKKYADTCGKGLKRVAKNDVSQNPVFIEIS